jgi:hypothetical protein
MPEPLVPPELAAPLCWLVVLALGVAVTLSGVKASCNK